VLVRPACSRPDVPDGLVTADEALVPPLRPVLQAARHAMKSGVQCVLAYWKPGFMALL